MKWGSRAATLGREADRRCDKGIALVFMVGPSTRRFVLLKFTIAHQLRVFASISIIALRDLEA
jgi:hypothetical protein